MGKRSVLGKGLGALIPEAAEGAAEPEAGDVRVIELDVSEVAPNPYQPRTEFDPAHIEELKRSILEKGIIQPVTVRRLGGGYQLIAGERRLRAAREAGMDRIPALVMDISSPEEMMELSLIENVQRENLNPIEEAKAYRMLVEQCHLTQEEVSAKVGKDRSTVANLLRLLRLPPEVQDHLSSGALTVGHARALLAFEDEETQLRLCARILNEGLTVRKVEGMVRGSEPAPPRPKPDPDILVASIVERLQRVLGTPVKIVRKGKKGTVEIPFHDQEELERLIEVILALESS
jgi:ParB family transcriptional regulator, chromosome partitioning protein